MRLNLVVACVAGCSFGLGSARAQTFVNGNFETNDLSGWTIVNTANGVGAPGSVISFDIDGPGALGVSPAAAFMVGLAVFMQNSQGGIEMTQPLNLTGGTAYLFKWDCAAARLAPGGNASGGVFSLIVDGVAQGVPVSLVDISAATPQYGHGNVTFTAPSTGSFMVGLRVTRPFQAPGDLTSYVDNLTVTGGSAPCYANCDASTIPPVLNVNDFTCFVNQYAAATSYANCDASTIPPVLNVNDYTCFLNRYAAGCP